MQIQPRGTARTSLPPQSPPAATLTGCWRTTHRSPEPAAPVPWAGPGGEAAPPCTEELRSQEAGMGESLPPWISVPESDAKGRNSTAVSNAQLTPTMGICQEKGRGKGETTTISICLGPECLLKQHKIRFAQGHADRSRQAEPRSSSQVLAQRRSGTTAQAGRGELATLPSPDWLCPPFPAKLHHAKHMRVPISSASDRLGKAPPKVMSCQQGHTIQSSPALGVKRFRAQRWSLKPH